MVGLRRRYGSRDLEKVAEFSSRSLPIITHKAQCACPRPTPRRPLQKPRFNGASLKRGISFLDVLRRTPQPPAAAMALSRPAPRSSVRKFSPKTKFSSGKARPLRFWSMWLNTISVVPMRSHTPVR